MPSGFASLDTNFPKLEGMSNEQRIQTLTSYLYQLLENLRYVLSNLGEENINESDWKKITNAVVFTALGQEGATIINGANISTGSIDASKASIINIDADNINTGALHGINIYGAQYRDEEDQYGQYHAMLDITSNYGVAEFLFGTNMTTDQSDSILYLAGADNGYGTIGLFGNLAVEFTRDDGTGNPAITFDQKVNFLEDIQLPAGSQYPNRTEVQAMIDASIAAAMGGA